MSSTIYEYSYGDDPPIRQGDIFFNLPYFNYDFLTKSKPEKLDIPIDESEEILKKIVRDGGQIPVEGFYYSTWGILASQDCDNRKNRDLIFYPLIPVEALLESDNIIETVENKIVKSTRHVYIPKLILSNGNEHGPFEINFYNPFNVPYNILIENLEYCWKARLIEKARKVFIGKITHFYTRTPVDEFIFLENEEITSYLVSDWKNIWREKSAKKYKEGLVRISQIKKILKSVKRESDIDRIFYYDLFLVDKLKKILLGMDWFSNIRELLTLINIIKNEYLENPSKANQNFIELIKSYCISENSLVNNLRNFLDQYYDDLKELRRKITLGGECDLHLVKSIFPNEKTTTKTDIKKTIESISDTRNYMREIPNYCIDYYHLFLANDNEENII